jgi:hypothetical protein
LLLPAKGLPGRLKCSLLCILEVFLSAHECAKLVGEACRIIRGTEPNGRTSRLGNFSLPGRVRGDNGESAQKIVEDFVADRVELIIGLVRFEGQPDIVFGNAPQQVSGRNQIFDI